MKWFRHPGECVPVIPSYVLDLIFFDNEFIRSLKKDDAIDVEFRVVEEPKQLTEGKQDG